MLPGIAAVVLFAVLAVVFVGAPLGAQQGFPEGESITANIGYSMFDLDGMKTVDSENFLITFEIIDVLLVAALVGAVMLARREPGGLTTALGGDGEDDVATDGGRRDDRDRGGDR
jgi:NADH-quinone oxidoreductase subunit J